jgi:hypothetical protein
MAWDKFSSLSPEQFAALQQQLLQQRAQAPTGEANSYYDSTTPYYSNGTLFAPTYGDNAVAQGRAMNAAPTGYTTYDYNEAANKNQSLYNGQPYTSIDNTGKVTGNGNLSGFTDSSFMSEWGPFLMALGPMAATASPALGAAASFGANPVTGAAAAGSAAGAAGAGGAALGNSFDGGALNAAVMNGAGGTGAAGGAGSAALGNSFDGGALNGAVMNGSGAAGTAGVGASTAGGIDTAGNALNTAVMNGGAGVGAAGTAAGTAAGAGSAGSTAASAASGLGKYLGPAASVVGGIYGANAAKDAAATQAESADKALQLQRDMFNKVVDLNEPFRAGGVQGMNALQTALGLAPGTDSGWAMKDFAPSDLTTDPSYQWRLDQGQQALERSAAAKGGLLSGGFGKDLTNYAQGAASQEYGNAFNRYQTQRSAKLAPLQSLAGVGQSTAGTVGNAAQSYGNNAANLITGAGNATAAGQVGAANALTSAIGQGVSQYQNNELLNRLLPQR